MRTFHEEMTRQDLIVLHAVTSQSKQTHPLNLSTDPSCLLACDQHQRVGADASKQAINQSNRHGFFTNTYSKNDGSQRIMSNIG